MITQTSIRNFSRLPIAVRATPADLISFNKPFDTRGSLVPFRRGAEIFGEGEPAEYLYKVVDGSVRTHKFLNDGRRQIGAFYLSGEIFGLEATAEHTYSAEAVADCKVLVIKRSAIAALVTRNSDVARELWTLAATELERTQNHIMVLVQSAKERVAGFLLEMAARNSDADEFELPMSRQDIADYLGLTIETVSRMLTKLEKSGVISIQASRRIVLRKRRALNRLNA